MPETLWMMCAGSQDPRVARPRAQQEKGEARELPARRLTVAILVERGARAEECRNERGSRSSQQDERPARVEPPEREDGGIHRGAESDRDRPDARPPRHLSRSTGDKRESRERGGPELVTRPEEPVLEHLVMGPARRRGVVEQGDEGRNGAEGAEVPACAARSAPYGGPQGHDDEGREPEESRGPRQSRVVETLEVEVSGTGSGDRVVEDTVLDPSGEEDPVRERRPRAEACLVVGTERHETAGHEHGEEDERRSPAPRSRDDDTEDRGEQERGGVHQERESHDAACERDGPPPIDEDRPGGDDSECRLGTVLDAHAREREERRPEEEQSGGGQTPWKVETEVQAHLDEGDDRERAEGKGPTHEHEERRQTLGARPEPGRDHGTGNHEERLSRVRVAVEPAVDDEVVELRDVHPPDRIVDRLREGSLVHDQEREPRKPIGPQGWVCVDHEDEQRRSEQESGEPACQPHGPIGGLTTFARARISQASRGQSDVEPPRSAPLRARLRGRRS